MSKHRITWIVMADGSRARIVKPREEGAGFDVLFELASPEAHMPTHELGSAPPGRTQESGASAHHAIEPRHDAHEAAKTAFVRRVADQLNRAAADASFDALIVFAPPRCLGELRQALDHGTRGRITAASPKDLTKLPLAELPAHLDALARTSS